jgi:sialate O-acetylesterase
MSLAQITRSLTFVLMAIIATSARAAIRLPKILSSHAVLQQDQPIHIWGWSDPGENVTTSLGKETVTATGDRLGRWSAYLPPQHAGGPFQLTVAGTNKIVLDDILLGDVWFASGQSNMEMPLSGFTGSAVVHNAAEEIRNANQPAMRLLLIPRKATPYPLNDFEDNAAWTACTPETAAKFSAVAYFFGREIAAREHVAIGLIDATWGGTPAEAWVSLDGLSANSSLMPVFASWAKMAAQQSDMQALLQAEQRDDEAARAAHTQPAKHPWHPVAASWTPSWLYNAMISPAVDFGIKGVIWYQGETNSKLDRAPLYQQVFSTLIADWRRHWHEGDFPFLFTQISSFKSDETEDWPTVREAQRRTLSLANTGMAVTIDVGDPDNVHPSDKQTVGARLALVARALAYHENLEYSGPLFRQATTEQGAMRVWFTHGDRELVAKGSTVEGFEIAGDDHRFVVATARIDGVSLVVSSPEIKAPKYVRYGWQNAPEVNLYNSQGLPASPFTSE